MPKLEYLMTYRADLEDPVDIGAVPYGTRQIFDVRGARVRTLVDGRIQPPGEYQISWDGTDRNRVPVSSGIYFYRLTVGGQSLSKKIVMIRR